MSPENGGERLTKVEEAITEHWGRRCPDFAEHCPCCQAWAEYDMMRIALLQRVGHVRDNEGKT